MKKENKPKLVEMKTVSANELLISVSGEDNRVYRFVIPWGSPLDEAYHACINAANEVARLFNEAVEQQQKKAAEEKAKKEEE